MKHIQRKSDLHIQWCEKWLPPSWFPIYLYIGDTLMFQIIKWIYVLDKDNTGNQKMLFLNEGVYITASLFTLVYIQPSIILNNCFLPLSVTNTHKKEKSRRKYFFIALYMQ